MAATTEPFWTKDPPSAYDIAACFYPDSDPAAAGQKLRPCLITTVFRRRLSGYACRVAYGTTRLKVVQRRDRDLIIQETGDLSAVGLARATRFDPDATATLPWTEDFFGCWTGYSSPSDR
jgi:hypothetical protein